MDMKAKFQPRSRARSSGSTLPLTGIRVVTLEQAVAAPLCTRHMADLGADIIKIERPPHGDFARAYDSVVRGQSAYFVWLNRGKRSLTLDVQEPADRLLFGDLLTTADVFVHNLGPGAVDRLGFDWESVNRRSPALIVCAISGYGTDGPYRDRKAYDLLLQGESGLTSITGTAEAPVKVGISVADISAAMYAFASILAALYERKSTGRGRFIDISMLECLAEWMMAPIYHQLYAGCSPPRMGMRHNMIVPYGPFQTGDGSWVNLAVQNDPQWVRLCRDVLMRPELAADSRFNTNERRVENRGVLEALIEENLRTHTLASITGRLTLSDIPFGELRDVAGLVAHPQLRKRRRWFWIDTPNGRVRALKHPMNLLGLEIRDDPVPEIGEHSVEIRQELARMMRR